MLIINLRVWIEANDIFCMRIYILIWAHLHE